MAKRQLQPLQVNPTTGEYFLRLPAPLENIIITPPRMSDAPFSVLIHNNPRVYKWLKGTPYPMLLEHAEGWLKLVTSKAQELIRTLEAADQDGDLMFVDQCPVSALREVNEDGTDTFIGSVDIGRASFVEYVRGVTGENKAAFEEANKSRKPGDPEIVYSFGDFLAPSHHGRGIMTKAVATIIHQWAIPRMGARHMMITAFEGNIGSVKVFEKNGFVMRETRHGCEMSVHGVKEIRSCHILDWELEN